jgi:putative MATE family efflux protein
MSESTDIALAAPVAAGSGESIWRAVREALRGSRRNYTEGPIGRAILILAIPMVLEMMMESVFVVCDVFFVSKLGPDAVATVSLTESLLAIVYTIAMGLSIGVTATVARRTGEHDSEERLAHGRARHGVGLFVAVVLGVLGAISRRHAEAHGSLRRCSRRNPIHRVMLGGNASILLLFLINGIFRGAGDAQLSMRTLWLANAISIVLRPCLIFGLGPFPRLGVTGTAIATTIGRSTGVVFGLSQFFRQSGRVHIHRRHLTLDSGLMVKLLRLSGSGMFQVLIGTASWIGLVRILAGFGSTALAGYTIAIRIVLFALLPSWGMGNAAATMVGQALGAGKPDRAERAVWRAAFYNLCFLGVVGVIFVFGARHRESLRRPTRPWRSMHVPGCA